MHWNLTLGSILDNCQFFTSNVHLLKSRNKGEVSLGGVASSAIIPWFCFSCPVWWKITGRGLTTSNYRSVHSCRVLDCLNSLTTVGYLLGVFFRLWIPFLVRISTFAWSHAALETWAKASLTIEGIYYLCHCRPRLFSSQWRQLPCAQHLGVNPPTSPYPTFFGSAKPIFKTDCTNS